jgi:hypothetical protein
LTVTDFVFVFLTLARSTPFVGPPLGFGIVGLEYLWLGLTPASGPVVSFQLSFCSHESSLHRVFTEFKKKLFTSVFFLWVVSTCVLICLMLLILDFYSQSFFFFYFLDGVRLAIIPRQIST